MDQQKVKSREYKIMLRASEFRGGEEELLRRAGVFWGQFAEGVGEVVLDVDGNLDDIAERRLIRFFDTKGHRLRRNGYVFREREDVGEDSEREVTLKFRHPDRYLAQDRDMDPMENAKGKPKRKFEEDVKPPSTRLFSFSTTQKIGDRNLNRMDDPATLYPGLEAEFDEYDGDEDIFVVGEFTAREKVIEGADFQIGEDPKVEAECALVVWYDLDGDETDPEVVEFSYKYGDDEEQYRGAPARRAHDVLMMLQQAFGSWVDPASKTKTGFVYDRAHDSAREHDDRDACRGEGCGGPPPTSK
jgi:hypothetical protein